jgi:FecR protein
MKRISIIIGLVVLSALMMWAYFSHQKSNGTPAPTTVNLETPPTTIAVTPLAADVSLLGAAQGVWNVIASTSNVSDGSKVKTSPDGRAIIAREATIISSLDNNTEVTLNFSSDKKQSHLALTLGRIWSKVGRALEQDEQFEVYTPTMVAAVRGTSFGVSLDPKRSLIVTEGTVWITRRNPQTGEQLASSTIAVPAGNKVEDDGVHFLVRPFTVADKDDWYKQNNPEPGAPPPKNSIEQFIQTHPVTTPPLSPGAIPATVVSPAPAPVISSVSPRQFDTTSVTVVRVSGTNLDSVTKVLLNKKPVEFSITNVGVVVISTTEFRDGLGTYDVSLTSPTGTATLNGAFTLRGVTPVIAISRSTFAYDETQTGYIYVYGTNLDSADTVLIAGQSAKFEVVSSSELRVSYARLSASVSVEVRAGTQSVKGTVSP